MATFYEPPPEIGDRSAQMIEGIKAEFPGAWE